MPVGEPAGSSLAEIGSRNRGLAYLRRLIRHDALRGHPEARQVIEEYLSHPSVRDARRRPNRQPADPGRDQVSA